MAAEHPSQSLHTQCSVIVAAILTSITGSVLLVRGGPTRKVVRNFTDIDDVPLTNQRTVRVAAVPLGHAGSSVKRLDVIQNGALSHPACIVAAPFLVHINIVISAVFAIASRASFRSACRVRVVTMS
jgi:hypothetical protein